MKKLIAMMVLLSTLLCGSALALTANAEEAPVDDGFYHGEKSVTTVWTATSNNNAHSQHRIPGIVVTKKDTVIIYCEARTGDTTYSLTKKNDWCLMDIYIQRSEDGGKTFGEPIYIAKGNRQTACVNNPVMIVGNDNTLHMLYCKNYSIKGGGLWYRKSTDDGLTWTPEVSLSKFTESVPHDCFAFGPTHGICTRDGVLMSAVWLVPKGTGRDGDITSHGPSKTYVFYSKDNGETWALSEVASGNSNETNIVQLSDGSILLNSRSKPNRKITTSPNGINNWTTTYADETLIDPACCAGLTTVDIPGLPYAHLFTNCATTADRTKVTLRVSFDDCMTWEKSIMLDQYNGGYSDVAIDSKGKIYVLYEWAMGNRMRLYTCSFVDEFMSDADEKRTSEQTEFVFKDEDSISMLSTFNHLKVTVSEESLCLTATTTFKHSFRMNVSDVTEGIFLHRNKAVALKIRVNSQKEGDMALGAYFQTGRLDEYNKEKFQKVSVPNDGEWHTVFMDLEEAGVEGLLHGIRFELFTDTLRCEVGDTVEIASIGFYANEEDAREELGLNTTESLTTEEMTPGVTPDATTEAPVTEEKKGCGAATPSLMAGLLSALAALPLFGKRRRKD